MRRGAPAAYDVFVLARPTPGVAAMLAIALGRREQRLYKAVASIAATPERTL